MTTVAWRRSPCGAGAAVLAVGVESLDKSLPHSLQNLAPSGLPCRHFGHSIFFPLLFRCFAVARPYAAMSPPGPHPVAHAGRAERRHGGEARPQPYHAVRVLSRLRDDPSARTPYRGRNLSAAPKSGVAMQGGGAPLETPRKFEGSQPPSPQIRVCLQRVGIGRQPGSLACKGGWGDRFPHSGGFFLLVTGLLKRSLQPLDHVRGQGRSAGDCGVGGHPPRAGGGGE